MAKRSHIERDGWVYITHFPQQERYAVIAGPPLGYGHEMGSFSTIEEATETAKAVCLLLDDAEAVIRYEAMAQLSDGLGKAKELLDKAASGIEKPLGSDRWEMATPVEDFTDDGKSGKTTLCGHQ